MDAAQRGAPSSIKTLHRRRRGGDESCVTMHSSGALRAAYEHSWQENKIPHVSYEASGTIKDLQPVESTCLLLPLDFTRCPPSPELHLLCYAATVSTSGSNTVNIDSCHSVSLSPLL